MSRYIDADRLKKHFEWWESEAKAKEFKEIFDEIIDAQPTAAVVEVVRCKECKHYWKNWKDGEPSWGDGVAVCLASPKDDAFCSEGERREDAEIH